MRKTVLHDSSNKMPTTHLVPGGTRGVPATCLLCAEEVSGGVFDADGRVTEDVFYGPVARYLMTPGPSCRPDRMSELTTTAGVHES